ncbi:MAG: MBL fold metallo-hydrolase [Bacteroidota bacterium]
MKSKFIPICLIVLFMAGMFSLPAWNNLRAQTNAFCKKTVNYIEVVKLKENVIIVKLGSDVITAIAARKGIVVIDAGISNSLTSNYRSIIEKEFKRNDFAYLINTHSHPDHTGGNQMFSDAIIIGHENCAIEMSEYWKDREKVKSDWIKTINQYTQNLDTLNTYSRDYKELMCQKIRYESAYNDLANGFCITPPTLTFNDSLTIDMGDAKLNLYFFGRAHSGSDIIIHIPELKILMTGDLFSRYGRLSMADSEKRDTERWLKVVKWIENRWTNIDLIIGGHGQIMHKEDIQAFNKNIRKYADK